MKKKRFKKIWVISLVLTAIFLGVVGSVAIYTSQVYQRAVVRNRYNDVIRFSSDKLLTVETETLPSEIYYPVAEGQNTMTFTVCNYAQTKSTLPNDASLTYTISFKFENSDEDFSYHISCNDTVLDNLTSYTHNLPGGTASVDTYTITFSEKDYQKMKLTVTVTPEDSLLTKNRILTGTLIPILYGTTQQFQVHMEFPDSQRKNTDGSYFTPENVDAYNVLLSVTGGQGKVYIRWKSNEVEMDSYFCSEHAPSKDGDWLKTVLFMDSADNTSSYLIPFYNPNSSKPGWTDWNQLKASIEVGIVEN